MEAIGEIGATLSTLNLDQFRGAWRSGGLRSVGVIGKGDKFFIVGQPRTGDRVTLATARGKMLRAFRDAGKAIAVLHEMGARMIEVDTSGWAPELEELDWRRRPATVSKSREQDAAVHETWFRAEVEKSLSEADDLETRWLTNEEADQQSAALLASLKKNDAGRTSN